jgi:hypothetical protein
MTRKKIVLLMPVLLTVFLVLWWVLEERRSSYGSWHVYLALAIMPLVLIWHIGLIVSRKPRIPMVAYAATHLALFVPIWFFCLMQLSHDSF